MSPAHRSVPVRPRNAYRTPSVFDEASWSVDGCGERMCGVYGLDNVYDRVIPLDVPDASNVPLLQGSGTERPGSPAAD